MPLPPRLRCLLLAALIVAAPVAGNAQPLDHGSSAQELAGALLAGLPGTAAAGTLRAGAIRVAVQRDPGVARGSAKGAAEPVFEIGSVSKVFTGLLLAQAVERGELRLDDRIGELLRGRVRFRSPASAAITLGQLVTHTSCLPDFPENPKLLPAAAQITGYTRAQLWNALATTSIPRTPPCRGDYSNFGFAVLGELLAQRAGKPWDALVRERITQPLGMHDTARLLAPAQQARVPAGFVREVPAAPWKVDAFAGAGGLHSTATDLLVFSKALLAGRSGPLGAAAERLVAPLAAYGTKSTRIGYGVFLPATDEPAWVHNGITGGFVAEWIVWPGRGEAVVLLASNLAAPARPVARMLMGPAR